LEFGGCTYIFRATPRGRVRSGGAGVLVERILIHNLLALEISTAYFASNVEQSVPFDLLVKVPFEATLFAEVYVGAGPALSWVRNNENEGDIVHVESGFYPGILTTAGVYWWTNERVGILSELDFAQVFEETLTQE
jgi:hypothetical protein